MCLFCLLATTSNDRKRTALTMFEHGMRMPAIAVSLRCTRARVHQILSEVGAVPAKLPLHDYFSEVVLAEVKRHGPNYGRIMLLGALRANYPAWRWPERAVRAVLKTANPDAHNARRHWMHHRIERGVYFAPYFMYSLHVDMACKLQEYHLMVGAAIDGCTRFAVRLVALTDKLPATLFNKLFVPTVHTFGLPDQLITDKGSEWCIMAFACYLAVRSAQRIQRRQPHRFVQSKRNVLSFPCTRCNAQSICVQMYFA